MAFKRALVVDDSKLARVALKKLLEQHDLDVIFAESGEAALELLERETVDAIFMDHHMPGMDGLEAVAALKKNPRTATIPVMMYTTREGEVYVSQARALGAVAVLPKQVQPGVLFEMLEELGLVKDRRAPAGQEPPNAREAYEVDRRGRDLNDEVAGISLQAIVTRILEDQHLALRADILRGNRNFARQVAGEILRETREAEAPLEPEVSRSYSQGAVTLLVLLLLVPALVFGGLWLTAAEERDSALAELAGLDRTLSERMQVAESVTSNLLADMKTERNDRLSSYLTALEWSLNENGGHSLATQAFDRNRVQQLETLLEHLEKIGFRGTVRLTSHLGEFCLDADRLGELRPAPADTAVTACGTVGHPLDGSSFSSDRQSMQFTAFLARRGDRAGGIRIEVVSNDRFASTRRYAYPGENSLAGEWNAVAARNNRVEYEFLPELGDG